MKKLTLILVAMFASGMMFGQLHFGPQIGFTSSKLTTNLDDAKTSFKSNFLFGAFVRLGDKIYVQPEINWMTQGGVWTEDNTGVTDPGKIEMDYKTIQIPVSVGWRLIDLKLANIRVSGGFAANIITDKKLKFTQLEAQFQDSDLSDMIWQYQVGVGVDVLMFALDLKYMGGINDMFKNDVNFDGKTLSTKSNLFMVTLGWKIF